MRKAKRLVAVVGATGYVGGRLVESLLTAGYRPIAMGRSLKRLKERFGSTRSDIELAEASVLDPQALERALRGAHAAYYLVHSMTSGVKDYQDQDRKAADSFAQAAKSARMRQIIYLGGLGEDRDDLSTHLRSRREVEDILKSGGIPVTVLRAAMIIGSGSASFEILRYLVERLPVMVTPRWVKTPCQPIAILNVLNYLVGCLDNTEVTGQTFDIGGSEIVTYDKLMRTYAEEAGLPRRWVIPVPVLTPRLSSYWIHLVTPVPASIARPLAEGLKNPVICQNQRLAEIIPQALLSPREAIVHALGKPGWGEVLPPEIAMPGDPRWAGGTVYRDIREAEISTNADAVWKVVEGIGRTSGWYHANYLWKLRGLIDRLIGGVGLRRGRRTDALRAGDPLDFWRVVRIEPQKSLLLKAEMKLPGEATLEFSIGGTEPDKTVLTQTATFRPKGLLGIVYWYTVLPLHAYIFGGMIKKIMRRAEKDRRPIG